MQAASGMFLSEDLGVKEYAIIQIAPAAPAINFWYVLVWGSDVMFWIMILSVKLESVLNSTSKVWLQYILYL